MKGTQDATSTRPAQHVSLHIVLLASEQRMHTGLNEPCVCTAFLCATQLELELLTDLQHILAVEETIIALVRIFQSLTFKLSDSCAEPLELRQGVAMTPKGGIPFHVFQRAGTA